MVISRQTLLFAISLHFVRSMLIILLLLTSVDPTACPLLQRLSLDMTNVSSVDLSKNPDLQVLNVSDSRISSLDLSHNPKIRELYISHTSGTVNTDISSKL